MKNISLSLLSVVAFLLLTFTSCQESLPDRAAREAREFTEKYCPTPPQNNVITDSIVFDKKTLTQINYLTFTDFIDNKEALEEHKEEMKAALLENIRQNTSMKQYKEAGYNIQYICRSQKDPKTILLDLRYTAKDYQ